MAGKFFKVEGSPWNNKLPVDAPISPSSATYVADLQRMRTVSTWWINRDAFSTEIVYVDSTTPRVPVYLIQTASPYTAYTPNEGGDRFAALAYRLRTVGVRIPPGTVPAPGSDRQLVILDTDTGEMTEMWVLEFDRGDRNPVLAGNWSCMYGGWMADHRQNIGIYLDSDVPFKSYAAWGATATSLPLIGGLMLDEEIVAAEIPHALQVVLPDPGPGVVWPAQRGDGIAGKVIPEGSWFRIKTSVDVNSYNASASTPTTRLRTIAKAMQDYGVIVNDKSGIGASLSLRLESSSTVIWGESWDTLLARIPLTDFEFIDPSFRPAIAAPPPGPPTEASGGPYWGVRA